MLRNIRLQHFRSYTDSRFDFSPGVNIISGPNASGKTNLLESILVVCRGASYRVRDADLVAFGSEWCRVDATVDNETVRSLKLQIDAAGAWRKTFEIDSHAYQRLSPAKLLPAVLFEPNHLLLLTTTPDLRRTFLDDLIEQIQPGYGTIRRHYRRVLSQRNALLKRGEAAARQQLFTWNLRLSELGGRMAAERLSLIERMNQAASDVYAALAEQPVQIDLRYASGCALQGYETSLLQKLEANIARDCLIGYTTAGPHRDDLSVLLNGHRIAESASRGETRTLVLMLKILELKQLHEAAQVPPVLLLDDVFSELDAVRRRTLTRYLRDYQTFITTTDADVVTEHFTQADASVNIVRTTLSERTS